MALGVGGWVTQYILQEIDKDGVCRCVSVCKVRILVSDVSRVDQSSMALDVTYPHPFFRGGGPPQWAAAAAAAAEAAADIQKWQTFI